MWSHETFAMTRRLARAAAIFGLLGLTAGCFQPMYGDRSPGGPGMRMAMASVDVEQIQAPPATPHSRLAVEVRNELTYLLTGGDAALSPTHRLTINLSVSGTSLIVDPSTARPEYEVSGVDANFKLVELATGKQVFDGSATHRASYVIPGQQQRYDALRGQRDTQSRAARVVAEQIRNRVAAYFAAAGT
jgi:LPS-assembly lipoprotein